MSLEHSHSLHAIDDRIHSKNKNSYVSDWILGGIDGAVTTFAIGAGKSLWALSPWYRSGFETLAIGMAAAGVAYAVGYWLKGIIH